MTPVFDLINRNLFWCGLIAFLSGAYFGGAGAWGAQGMRLHAEKERYDTLILKIKGEALQAQLRNQEVIDENKRQKEKADHAYEQNSASLHADIRRLQNARASRRFLPSATTTPGSIDVACFNQEEFERTLQQFDHDAQELVTEGDDAIVGLNVAKRWGQNL